MVQRFYQPRLRSAKINLCANGEVSKNAKIICLIFTFFDLFPLLLPSKNNCEASYFKFKYKLSPKYWVIWIFVIFAAGWERLDSVYLIVDTFLALCCHWSGANWWKEDRADTNTEQPAGPVSWVAFWKGSAERPSALHWYSLQKESR